MIKKHTTDINTVKEYINKYIQGNKKLECLYELESYKLQEAFKEKRCFVYIYIGSRKKYIMFRYYYDGKFKSYIFDLNDYSEKEINTF